MLASRIGCDATRRNSEMNRACDTKSLLTLRNLFRQPFAIRHRYAAWEIIFEIFRLFSPCRRVRARDHARTHRFLQISNRIRRLLLFFNLLFFFINRAVFIARARARARVAFHRT